MITAGIVPISLGVGVGSVLVWALRSRLWRGHVRTMWQHLLRSRREPEFFARDAAALEWTRNQSHTERAHYEMKPLLHDPHSGQAAMLVRYPAGSINPLHHHPVGHGMYVLEGELVTHRGRFGPGNFVWFPGSESMWHGAGAGGDLVVLFMASGNLETRYLHAPHAR